MPMPEAMSVPHGPFASTHEYFAGEVPRQMRENPAGYPVGQTSGPQPMSQQYDPRQFAPRMYQNPGVGMAYGAAPPHRYIQPQYSGERSTINHQPQDFAPQSGHGAQGPPVVIQQHQLSQQQQHYSERHHPQLQPRVMPVVEMGQFPLQTTPTHTPSPATPSQPQYLGAPVSTHVPHFQLPQPTQFPEMSSPLPQTPQVTTPQPHINVPLPQRSELQAPIPQLGTHSFRGTDSYPTQAFPASPTSAPTHASHLDVVPSQHPTPVANDQHLARFADLHATATSGSVASRITGAQPTAAPSITSPRARRRYNTVYPSPSKPSGRRSPPSRATMPPGLPLPLSAMTGQSHSYHPYAHVRPAMPATSDSAVFCL